MEDTEQKTSQQPAFLLNFPRADRQQTPLRLIQGVAGRDGPELQSLVNEIGLLSRLCTYGLRVGRSPLHTNLGAGQRSRRSRLSRLSAQCWSFGRTLSVLAFWTHHAHVHVHASARMQESPTSQHRRVHRARSGHRHASNGDVLCSLENTLMSSTRAHEYARTCSRLKAHKTYSHVPPSQGPKRDVTAWNRLHIMIERDKTLCAESHAPFLDCVCVLNRVSEVVIVSWVTARCTPIRK